MTLAQRLWLVGAIVLSVTVTACNDSLSVDEPAATPTTAQTETAAESTTVSPTTTATPSTTAASTSVAPTSAPLVGQRDLAELDEAGPLVNLVEAFWREVDADLGFEYDDVAIDRLVPRSGLLDGSATDECSWENDVEILYEEDVEENAFVTICDEGITVVYDDVDYMPDLEQRFPGAGNAMLFAHEWGHVIQFQLALDNQSSLLAEQQADCWSGAYAAWAERNRIDPFDDPASLDLAIISTLETRDEIGGDPMAEGAHGNGFDRVRATQEGYELGPKFCFDYTEESLPITQFPFTDTFDLLNNGNLPYDEAVELLSEETATYFESLTDESLDQFVDLPDAQTLEDLYDGIGDNAVGTEYAFRYAESLQESLGFETETRDAVLQRSCLVGSWLYDVSQQEEITLSPFDLDEAVQTLSTSNDLLSNPGLVFDMVAELRIGTFDGVSACGL